MYTDSLITASNDTLQGFYVEHTPAEVGELAQIEQRLGEGDYEAANNLINNFSPASNVQYNFKKFYSLYHKYRTTDSLSAGEWEDLGILISQCPFSDGPAVYKGRVFFEELSFNTITYSDDECILQGFSRISPQMEQLTHISNSVLKNKEDKQIKRIKGAVYSVFPNPVTDNITIRSPKESETVRVIIHDVASRECLTLNVMTVEHTKVIPLNLENGIYFISLINQEGLITAKKIVVAK